MKNPIKDVTPIYVVSGGKGVTGHIIVQTLIIQYPENKLEAKIIPDVCTEKRVFDVVKKVKEANGILAHTMVDSHLRIFLINECEKQQVKQVDLMGGLADIIENDLGLQSANTPGLYHRINARYFRRIKAIEYTLDHDDGLNAKNLNEADIVVIGVSRCGKTPLSVYMSTFGWKVANVPLIKGIAPPKELFEIDKNRVFGLDITQYQAIKLRKERMKNYGNFSNMNYVDSKHVREELQNANFIFEREKFTKISVTNKPIESTANEIIGLILNRFN